MLSVGVAIHPQDKRSTAVDVAEDCRRYRSDTAGAGEGMKFTLKELLLSAIALAVGAGMLAYLFSPYHTHDSILDAPMWFGGSALIGAGALGPYGRPLLGAIFGILVLPLVLGVILGIMRALR